MLSRTLNNKLRFVLDECIPPILRDSRWFMYPVFFIWCGFSHAKAVRLMDFKRREYLGQNQTAPMAPPGATLPNNEPKERFSLYALRKTDLNQGCIDRMLEALDPKAEKLLDVGAGKGYWCSLAAKRGLDVTACDLANTLRYPEIRHVQGSVLDLPFEDNRFDVVTCTHTLEHVLNLRTAMRELKRVTSSQLLIVVPCQREYYLTPDGHLNFFPFREKLLYYLSELDAECKKIDGDWFVHILKQPLK